MAEDDDVKEEDWEAEDVPEEEIINYDKIICSGCGTTYSLLSEKICPECDLDETSGDSL